MTGSMASVEGWPDYSLYSASKAALPRRLTGSIDGHSHALLNIGAAAPVALPKWLVEYNIGLLAPVRHPNQ